MRNDKDNSTRQARRFRHRNDDGIQAGEDWITNRMAIGNNDWISVHLDVDGISQRQIDDCVAGGNGGDSRCSYDPTVRHRRMGLPTLSSSSATQKATSGWKHDASAVRIGK